LVLLARPLLRALQYETRQPLRVDRQGAFGSHLEILERNDGFKGFNQTGISEIVLRTDPRKVAVQA
jgi:hypothetical protein